MITKNIIIINYLNDSYSILLNSITENKNKYIPKIRVTSILGFEKNIHMQLYRYLNENNLICDKQLGFRPNHSNRTMYFLFDWLHSRTNNHATLYLWTFFIYQKHSWTLWNQRNNNIFVPKLFNRRQYVICDKEQTTFAVIKAQVSQGSVLVPSLFLIFPPSVNYLKLTCMQTIQHYAMLKITLHTMIY